MKLEKVKLISHKSIDFINPLDILFCQSDYSYIHVYLLDERKISTVKTLVKFHEDLPSFFVRVNQTTLVNKVYVESIDKKEKTIILKGNKTISFTMPIKELLERIGKIELASSNISEQALFA